MENLNKARQNLILALKIAVGVSAAILIADLLGLDHSASAGTVTLLTLMTTKWETLRLSLFRMLSYVITMALGLAVFYFVDTDWLSYGIFIFFLIFITCTLGWVSTISVNAVLGTHLLLDGHFGLSDMANELMIVVIGVVIAIVLNLFHDYRHQKKTIIANMRYVEEEMRRLMCTLAQFLLNEETKLDTGKDCERLDNELKAFIKEAMDYQDNTFHSHPGYYIEYFRMRRSQCHIIENLHDELERIKTVPARAADTAALMEYIAGNIVEHADPVPQLDKIKQVFEDMKNDVPPLTADEFESRALLYHILSDLEEFLRFKQKFIRNLTPKQIEEYRS